MDSQVVSTVINVMMRGISPIRDAAPKEERDQFLAKHQQIIEDVMDWIPRWEGKRPNSGILAAMCKGYLLFGKNSIEMLCKAIRTAKFQGRTDPVFLLYRQLRHTGDPKSYRKTITGIRAFVEGRTLIRLAPCKRDLFNWTTDYSIDPTSIQRDLLTT